MNGQKTLAEAFDSIEDLEQAWDEFVEEMEDDPAIAYIMSDDFEPDSQDSIHIPFEIIDRVEQFLKNQNNPEKSALIKRSCLATWALNEYLTAQGYPGDLNQSHSWNPLIQQLIPASDLLIPELGRINCVTIQPEDTALDLAELDEDVLGTVFIEFSAEYDRARLVGVIPNYWLVDNPEVTTLERSALEQPELTIERLLQVLKDSRCILQELSQSSEETLKQNSLIAINTIVRFQRSGLRPSQRRSEQIQALEALYADSENLVEIADAGLRELNETGSSSGDRYNRLYDLLLDCEDAVAGQEGAHE